MSERGFKQIHQKLNINTSKKDLLKDYCIKLTYFELGVSHKLAAEHIFYDDQFLF